MKKIEHQPLSDRAYQAIREGLQEGVFQPMQPMVIRTLAAEYGISATPIREALQRLVAERLLIVLPNRSIVVPRMTRQRFLELMPIRTSLEGMAARLATPQFSKAELDALRNLVQRVSETTRTYDAKTYLLLNREFHFAIYEKAGNPELLQMINDLWLKVGPVFTGLFDDNYYRQHANDEHQNILAAIEKGDAEAAEHFMRQDIDIAAKALLPLMPEEAEA
ncbi:GntR family transcriptional regulator [Pseudodonghicola flavimaris]|uniref:GntR family transcriptional regulator n=1 Tax=Pseudodonghicola flavimaris TaxID=3050036 RepID=A0ABT7F5J2_9RHOB|nr:GntR family transcriptional regulator [Pseudodonghicola flavimaris]MDK3019866.1 GntR family transcriptional regulator [Pseudodonghicola flavimaris]